MSGPEPAARQCSCGATIIFARSTKTGRSVPLQRVTGHVYELAFDEENPTQPVARPREYDPDAGLGHVYLSHFLTCPDRDKFSRRSATRGGR